MAHIGLRVYVLGFRALGFGMSDVGDTLWGLAGYRVQVTFSSAPNEQPASYMRGDIGLSLLASNKLALQNIDKREW